MSLVELIPTPTVPAPAETQAALVAGEPSVVATPAAPAPILTKPAGVMTRIVRLKVRWDADDYQVTKHDEVYEYSWENENPFDEVTISVTLPVRQRLPEVTVTVAAPTASA